MYKTINKSFARILRTPQYLILFVSNNCWMKCEHCWFNEEWKESNLNEQSLTFEEFEKIAESIKRINFLSITGGEAFSRDDIVELANMFAEKTKLNRYQIPTSGYLTDDIISKTEKILKNNPGIPFRVDVSLDGDEETHNFIRNRKKSFANAVETIKRLNKLKHQYSYFDVGVISTISNQNQNIVDRLAETIEDIKHDGEWMVNLVRGKTRAPKSIDVDLNNYIKAHKHIDSRIENGTYKGHSGHILAPWLTAKNIVRRNKIVNIVEGKCRGGACSAGSLGGVIYNDGSVYPCEMLEHSFGNIRDFNYDLPKLWNSPQGDWIRNNIEDTKCICTQECFLSLNLLMQPKHLAEIIKERIKLLNLNS
ncbi:MAG: radical SAM protein [Ignavibacteriae bacterium]|nr:radical SAM protein [Ignavibacteriota bacterium]